MKKFFALLLSAALLVSGCAFAEEAVQPDSCKLSGIMFATGEQLANDELTDLSRLSLEVDVTEDGKTGCFHVDVDGESVAEIGVTMKDELIVLHVESATAGHQDYTIDPVAALARVMQQGVDGLVGMLNALDTTALARQFLFGSETAETAEAPAEEITINLPDLGIAGDFVSVLMECVEGPKPVTLGGTGFDSEGNLTEIPRKEYQEVVISVDMEHLCRLLNMITLNGEAAGLGDALRESGVEMSFDGSFDMSDSDNVGGALFTVAAEGQKSEYQFSFEQHITEAGMTIPMYMSVTDNGESTSYGFTISTGKHEGEAFTADEVDLSSAIALGDLTDTEANGKLAEALMNVMSDATGAVMDVLFDALGVDFDALLEEMPAE